MKHLLHPARIGEHPLYARLRDCPDPHSAERREFFQALWKQYEPFAPKGFAKKLQIEFHQRWWEMYLTVGLLHLGFMPKSSRSDHGPDLLLEIEGRPLFLEATAPSVGATSDQVPEFLYNEVADFPERQCHLRLVQALTDKCSKFHEYIKKKQIPADACCMIALSASDLSQFGAVLDGVHPAPLSVLGGAGPRVVTIAGNRPPYSGRRDVVKRSSGSDVSVCLFEAPQFRLIAGVFYSPDDLWNATSRPEDSLSLFLNPDSTIRAPMSFTNRFVCWAQERLSEHEVIWRKTQQGGELVDSIAVRTPPLGL
jgi:hypothetical protein